MQASQPDPSTSPLGAFRALPRALRRLPFRLLTAAGLVTGAALLAERHMVWLGGDRLLVNERINKTTKFYVVDLAAAAPLDPS